MSEMSHPNITRLVVKNYRSLKEIDVGLHPLTVLVGKNGSGKSNLIDVLRFVRDALTSGFQEAVLMRGGMNALRCWFAEESEPISIHLEFEGAEWSGEYGLAFDSRQEQIYLLRERFSLTTHDAAQQISFEAVDGQIAQASVPVIEQASNKHALTKEGSLYLPKVALNLPAVQAVHDFLAKMNFYELNPKELRVPQPPRPPFPLSETGNNLASTLAELQRRQKDYLITQTLDVLIEELVGYEVLEVNGHLVTKLHYTYPAPSSLYQYAPPQTVSSSLRDEANGTIRLLALLAVVYQNRSPSPLAIEEPAKDIYSRELGLCGVVLKRARWSSQVIITTHSPDLIDGLPTSSFLVLEKEKGVTKIGPLIEYQREVLEKKMFSLKELIDIDGLHREGSLLRAKV